MQDSKKYIRFVQKLLSIQTCIKVILLTCLIFLGGMVYTQLKHLILNHQYQDLVQYCLERYPSSKLLPSNIEINKAHSILHNVRYEHMQQASQIYERSFAHHDNRFEFIEPLILSYIYRIPYEGNRIFHDNLKTLANNLIAKNSKSDHGNAILSALFLNKNNLIQAEKHFTILSTNHALTAILDFQIHYQTKKQNLQTLKDKLVQLKNKNELKVFYQMMQYKAHIQSGNYFAAKPILNKRLLMFPKDLWGQNLMLIMVKKGRNLELFKKILKNNFLNSNNAQAQYAQAEILCQQQQYAVCFRTLKNIIEKKYKYHTPKLRTDAKFKLIFYYLKNQQLNKAKNILKSLSNSYMSSASNRINLYLALTQDFSKKPISPSIAISLEGLSVSEEEQALAQFILAKYYISKNDTQNFEKKIMSIFESYPKFMSAKNLYVSYLIQTNNQKKAIDFANKFIYSKTLSPYHVYNQNVLYDSLYFESTLKQLDQSIRKNSSSFQSGILASFMGLSHLINYINFMNKGSLDKAAAYLRRALRKINNHSKSYLYLGIVYHYNKNIYLSNKNLNKSYSLQENDNNTLFWFAKNNLASKNNSRAEEILNRLKDKEKWKWPANRLLALLSLKNNQPKQALSILDALLLSDPNHFLAWDTLNLVEF